MHLLQDDGHASAAKGIVRAFKSPASITNEMRDCPDDLNASAHSRAMVYSYIADMYPLEIYWIWY